MIATTIIIAPDRADITNVGQLTNTILGYLFVTQLSHAVFSV